MAGAKDAIYPYSRRSPAGLTMGNDFPERVNLTQPTMPEQTIARRIAGIPPVACMLLHFRHEPSTPTFRFYEYEQQGKQTTDKS